MTGRPIVSESSSADWRDQGGYGSWIEGSDMMPEWLFDRNGRPQLIEDGDCFLSADGRVVGWISRQDAYSLSGRHIAWYENGVLYDGSNFAIGVCAGASGYL